MTWLGQVTQLGQWHVFPVFLQTTSPHVSNGGSSSGLASITEHKVRAWKQVRGQFTPDPECEQETILASHGDLGAVDHSTAD